MIRFHGRVARLLRSFGRARQGNVAMMAGIALPVLLMISAGAIDLHHMAKVKSELQDALDAATLAAARSQSANAQQIQNVGMSSLRANMPTYFVSNPGDTATFTLGAKHQVNATATIQVKTIVANIFLPPYGKLFDDYIPMTATSEVLRASRHVEVALALDVTGSMSTPKDYMPDLRTAADELVKIVVQGDQTFFKTRVALVPYAGGVNMGSYASAARGSLVSSVNITGVSVWAAEAKSISGSSNGTYTSSKHGLSNGDVVVLDGFSNSSINGSVRVIESATTDSFRFKGLSDSYSAANNQTRRVRKCVDSQCRSRITATNHGLNTNDLVIIESISRGGDLIGTHAVTRIDANSYYVSARPSLRETHGTTGKSQCGADGCAVRAFENVNKGLSTLASSNCVSERPRGSDKPTDTKPGTGNWMGRAYLETSNKCPTPTFEPLTNQLDTLTSRIAALVAGGSTAGQVGIEMAWYAISPTFSEIFPTDSRANAYDPSQTVKAVVLMTDGEFNTPFCQGVIASDSGTGSGNNTAKINCKATNGNGFAQSIQLCDAMKAQGVVVYTVGFNLSTSTGGFGVDTAYEVMRDCANSKDHFFPTTSGTDLKEAFKQIGRDITRLRIAR